jgi:signal transduction histidine kinase
LSWINRSLKRKFVVGTAAGLLVSSMVFLMLFITMYRGELESQQGEVVSQINSLLQTSLENAMLKRDLEGLRDIVDRLGNQPNIIGVMIANPAGEVRFSSNPDKLGQQIASPNPLQTTPTTDFRNLETGAEVMRSTNPVANKTPCIQCHGSITNQPVNGILYVDYDASSIRHKARRTTLMLMSSGALIVLLNIGGGWWFIRRYVINPVTRLSAASSALSSGRLDSRVVINGSDELTQLGKNFNNMAENLENTVLRLREKELYLQALIDAIPDGIRVIDDAYRIQVANHTYYEQHAIDKSKDHPGLCYTSSHHRETPCPATLTTCPIHEIKQNPTPLKFVHRHRKEDGSEMDVEVFAAPMRVRQEGREQTLVVESIRDLTKQVKFSHEQRLSELGRLAAGVAHEIHNPLTSVRLALHAAFRSSESENPDSDETLEYLRLVDKEIDTCISVTERLLKLSIVPGTHAEVVSLRIAIEETLSLLKWDAQERGIETRLHFDSDDVRVVATDGDVRMLTLNLVQNAFHAMPKGGRLSIEAQSGTRFVTIRFCDTGAGIEPEIAPNIFNPFFSRRADGTTGTGLGLSICRAIVEKHGGKIELESTDGTGTCFTVRLRNESVLREAEQ